MKLRKTLLSVLIGSSIATLSFAAGFQVFEQSTTLMGQANAGTGVTTDPSIQYYNPAGMAFVKDTEIGLSAIVLRTNAEFNPSQATGVDGRNILPTSSSVPPEFQTTIPGLYIVRPVNPDLRFGLGLESSFGLTTEYPDNSTARYFALESKLKTINLNPSFSYLFHNDFSIGGGLVMQYADTDLSQAVDGGGLVRLGYVNAGIPASVIPLLPQGGDFFVDNNASGLALGWDVGTEYKHKGTALGVSYHSHINQDLHGSATVTGNAIALQTLANAGTIFADTSADTRLDLPGFLTFSASQKLTNKWTVMTDVERIFWSRLKQVTINYAQPTMPNAVIDFDYRDTWRVALGQSYQVEKDLLLRMGVAWDQTPIPNQFTRSPRLPGNNRFWVSVGGTYEIDKHADISFGYSHIFIKSNEVNNTNPNFPLQTLVANYSGSADLVGVQLNLKFA